jgi:uncharacterized RDD family membrane protein YckC
MSQTYAPPAPPTGLEYAGWGRRVLARLIDGVAGALVLFAVLGPDRYSHSTWAPLALFFVQTSVGTALAGGSFGQLAMRVRVLHLDGRPLSLFAAMGRTALICLVIPPLVFRPEGRGLHDLAVRSGAFHRLPPL